MNQAKSIAIGVLTITAAIWAASNAFIPVPSNLHPEGIPGIPESLVTALEPYENARAAAFLDWHPSKREILVSTRFGDVPQVHLVSMPGGARTQLTFYPDRTLSAGFQPVSGESFIFSKDTGGAEFYQLYRFDLQSRKIAMITDGHSRNTDLKWSPDGKLLSFASTRRNGRDTDIYFGDPSLAKDGDTSWSRLLLQGEGGGWSPLGFSADGKILLAGDFHSVNETVLFAVDTQTGNRTQLTAEEHAYGSANLAPDGKGIYLTTDIDSDFNRLAYLDIASKAITILKPDLKWDVERVDLTLDGKRLAYVVNEDGYSTLHVWNTAVHKDELLPDLPHGVIATVKWHSNGEDLGFSLASAHSPSDVYSVNIATGKVERWTASETGGLNGDTLSEPALIHWNSFDGRQIAGFLYHPPGRFTGPRPVIIDIHGGPEGQFRPGFIGRNNFYIDELGIAMIYPNVRGSSGYGKTYLNLDNGLKREDSVKDIGALLDWIKTQPDLDASRIMVTGGSYGGYMTLASAFHFNDRLRCTVDVVGISSFLTFFEKTSPYRRDLRRVEYGDERNPAIHEFFTKISPIYHVNEITKPMFIVAGRNDPRVPVEEGQQMAAALKKSNIPAWLLIADDEGHGYSKKKNQDFQFAATVSFVKQYLLQ
jgi:dipeptidyl aminopeptidase/acylaminoacyl peptidase